MGRGSPFWKWPPRSPDFNPIDNFLWGSVKEAVYFDKIETVEELQENIEVTFALVDPEHVRRATQAIERRARACVEVGGGHFEHLMH